jgi:hypothetical protein
MGLSMPMNPRITELLDYLDRERAYLDRALASVPADRRQRRPSAEAWSVAEVVNRVGLIDTRIVGLLTKLTAEARAAGAKPDAETSPILSKMDLARITDRGRKIRNPRGDPPANCSTAEGLAALDGARASLRALLEQPDLPDLGAVAAPHIAFGPLNGYEWVAFIAAHAHRHADQILEASSLLG